ncbi:MAG: hypothetical protein A2V66_03690 [Ignavibacteria bacterium RBG_13_36_8]|nr:MAG: hypothetical protein A2V66_03690 [Ignavibacteria bacterium RBG_13_36_8]
MKDKKQTLGFYNWVIVKVQERTNTRLKKKFNKLLSFNEVTEVLHQYSNLYCQEAKKKFKKIFGRDL